MCCGGDLRLLSLDRDRRLVLSLERDLRLSLDRDLRRLDSLDLDRRLLDSPEGLLVDPELRIQDISTRIVLSYATSLML